MRELNPNHPVTQKIHGQWHKFCALLMLKMGVEEVEITVSDLENLASRKGGTNIKAHVHENTITLQLVTDQEAERLAREVGGLVI